MMGFKMNVLFIILYVAGGIMLESGFGFESPALFSFYGYCCAVIHVALSFKIKDKG